MWRKKDQNRERPVVLSRAPPRRWPPLARRCSGQTCRLQDLIHPYPRIPPPLTSSPPASVLHFAASIRCSATTPGASILLLIFTSPASNAPREGKEVLVQHLLVGEKYASLMVDLEESIASVLSHYMFYGVVNSSGKSFEMAFPEGGHGLRIFEPRRHIQVSNVLRFYKMDVINKKNAWQELSVWRILEVTGH